MIYLYHQQQDQKDWRESIHVLPRLIWLQTELHAFRLSSFEGNLMSLFRRAAVLSCAFLVMSSFASEGASAGTWKQSLKIWTNKLSGSPQAPLVSVTFSPDRPQQGSELSAFIQVQSQFVASNPVRTFVLAKVDGQSTPLLNPTSTLWIAQIPAYPNISSHVLEVLTYNEDLNATAQIRATITQLNQDILTLQTEIQNSTDPVQKAAWQTTLTEDLTQQAELQQQLINLRELIGDDSFNFYISENTASPNFPHISSVTPNYGIFNDQVPVRVMGSGFTAQSTVFFGGVQISGVTFVSATQLNLELPPGLTPGLKDIEVRIPSGTTYANDILKNGFLVDAGAAPASISYALSPAIYTRGIQIQSNVPTNTGGMPTSFSIAPSLPGGLSLDATSGVISGTPTTVTELIQYTVTGSNFLGTVTTALNLAVNDQAPTLLTYAQASAIYTKGVSISSNTPGNSGGMVTSFSVSPALPPGLAIDPMFGNITGTPTSITQFGAYTVTGTNTGGVISTTLLIAVNDKAPANLTYPLTTVVYTNGIQIQPNAPLQNGGPVTGYTINPNLPTGLTLNAFTGVISGTPQLVSATTQYTVTASNTGGSVSTPLTVTVNDLAPMNFTYSVQPAIYTLGATLAPNVPIVSGGIVLSYTVSPTLPIGLSMNAVTGIITGTPTVITGLATYTITATNSGGSASFGLPITVEDVSPQSLTYLLNPAVYTKGSAITANTVSHSGGVITGYSISPALPSGLSFNATTGTISGTPTVISPQASYQITASNSGGSLNVIISLTVNDQAPTNLAFSLNPATYTKGTQIQNNSPSSGGGLVISYSVTPSLPAGLSLNTATGIISGTPSAITSTASYAVVATNSGGSSSVSLSLTVNDKAPTGLTYSLSPAVYVKGGQIQSNSPTSSGGPVTHYSVSPTLSAGLSLDAISGIISGTPTQTTSATNYQITASNTGGSSVATVIITVNDIALLMLSNVTYPTTFLDNTSTQSMIVSNSGPSVATLSSISLTNGVPFSITGGTCSVAGTVAANSNCTVNVTFSPTVPGNSIDTVSVTYLNGAASATAVRSIQGNAISSTPTNLAYQVNPAVYTKGIQITSNYPSNTGGAITTYSVLPNLPAGLLLNASTGVISGTPGFLSPTANYVITGSNSTGSVTVTLTLTINDQAPTGLAYTPNPAAYTLGLSIANNSPTNAGGTILSYSVSPALPAGISMNTATGIISGTPTVLSAAGNYVITGTNTGGAAQVTLNLAVNDVAPAITIAGSPFTFTKGALISPITASNFGGPITGCTSTPTLPSGLSINAATCAVTGTPTVLTAVSSYTINATNSGGHSNQVIQIAVIDVPPSGFSYQITNTTYSKGIAITNDNPTFSGGGPATSYSVAPALPSGLSLSLITGVISGTPTVLASQATYTVTASNTGGNATTSVQITVVDQAPGNLAYTTGTEVFTIGIANANNNPSNSGGTILSYSISPALPAGINLNAATGVISGAPTVLSALTSYVVTGTNATGSTTVTLHVTVNDIAPTNLTYTTLTALYTLGTVVTNNVPSSTGGAIVAYSSSPSLPVGLTVNPTTGIISGTPTSLSPAANYVLKGTNSGGSSQVTLSIAVVDAAPVIAISGSPFTFTLNSAITAITATNTGGAITGCTSTPTLPSGLVISSTTCAVTGTPTLLAVSSQYTITATNSGGSSSQAIQIAVVAAPPQGLAYQTPSAVYTKSNIITNDSPTFTGGGAATSFSVSPALPAGLTISVLSGVISGTPTALSAQSTYTITASNTGGSVTTTVQITVVDLAPTALAYGPNPAVYTVGVAIANNTPTNSGGPVVSYSVSPALPAGLNFNSATGVISGTPTAVTAVASYIVTGTNSGGFTTVTLNITVNDAAPQGLAYQVPSAVYTNGTAITNNSPTFTGGGAATSFSVSPALPAGLTLSLMTGVISGTPTVTTAVAQYTVTASNSGGSVSAQVQIQVADAGPIIVTRANMQGWATPLIQTATTSFVESPSFPIVGAAGQGSFQMSTGPGNGTDGSGIRQGGKAFLSNTLFNHTLLSNLTKFSYSTYVPSGFQAGLAPYINLYVDLDGTHSVLLVYEAGTTAGDSPLLFNTWQNWNVIIPGSFRCTTPQVFGTKTCSTTPEAPNVGISEIVAAYPNAQIQDTTNVALSPTYPFSFGDAGLQFLIGSSTGGSWANITGFVDNISIGVSGTTRNYLFESDTQAAPTGLAYLNTSGSYTVGTTITNNNPTFSGGGGATTFSISPALPSGLTLDPVTGIISGTPTQPDALTSYTVTASNSAGSTQSTIQLTVIDVLPQGFAYQVLSAVYTSGTLITNNNPTFTGGGTATSYLVSPPLPAGLTLSVMTGVISGTPTAVSALTSYTVTASNSGGNVGTVIQLQVLDHGPYIVTRSNMQGWAMPLIQTATTSFVFSPSFPIGATSGSGSFQMSTGSGNGTNSAGIRQGGKAFLSNTQYNGVLLSAFTTFSFSTYVPSGIQAGLAPYINLYVDLDGVHAVLLVYEVGLTSPSDPLLPNTWQTWDVLTPAAFRCTTAQVFGSKTCSTTPEAPNVGLSEIIAAFPNAKIADITNLAPSPTYPFSVGDAGLQFLTGSSTGGGWANITGYLNNITIATGTGTQNFLFESDTSSGPAGLSYLATSPVYVHGSAISNNSPTFSGGGGATGFSVTPALPSGLSLDPVTGIISGTPAAATALSNYTVTGSNTSGSTSITLQITVN